MGRWLLTFLPTILIVVVSYHWFDWPIALLANTYLQFLGHRTEIERLSHSPNLFVPPAVSVLLGLVGLGLRPLSERQSYKAQIVALFCSVSVNVIEPTKNQLKFFFEHTGRRHGFRAIRHLLEVAATDSTYFIAGSGSATRFKGLA